MPADRYRSRLRFEGRIAGFGTASGTRFVIGMWRRSPFGTFADVMIERPEGHRLLIAPRRDLATFVGSTYTFDETVVAPVGWTRDGGDGLRVRAGGFEVRLRIGGLTPLGRMLRVVPRGVATNPAWSTVVDRTARMIVPGAGTTGRTGPGEREFYGVTRIRELRDASVTRDGEDLGGLAPLTPPVRFGFASAPATPSLIDLVATIELTQVDEE